MPTNDVPLPHSAQEIADVIGRDRTLHLIGQLPASGKRSWRVVFYVPASLPVDHWLVRVLGWRDAKRLSREFGGEILQPSNCRCIYRSARNHAIRSMAHEGMDKRSIAAVMELTERCISGILAKE